MDHQRIEAWKCIGCGRIEAPQICIGVCQDRRIELVDARTFDAVHRSLQAEREKCERLAGLLQRLAWSTPRQDGWERCYRAFQAEARQLLQQLRSEAQAVEPEAPVVRLDA